MKFSRSPAWFAGLLALCLCGPTQAEPPSQQAVINAAQQAADAGDYRRAETLLSTIPLAGGIDRASTTQINILRAQILLARNQPDEALKWLPMSAAVGAQAAQVHWLRGQALFRLGNGPGATYELVKREQFLSPAQLAENRDAIWGGLFETPMDLDVLRNLKSLDPETRGWVELAVLVRERANLDNWRASYPGHPGAERINTVRAAAPQAASVPQRLFSFFSSSADSNSLALLLPFTGAYSATAEAVRDGFLSAYYKQSGSRPSVRIYDAGATASSTVAAYQLALREGAGFIIGPLRKDGVAAIAGLGQPPVPMLALNYLEGTQPVFNLFQFGLAPEDEARAAAEQAVSEGGRRAIAFVQSTDWGERALAAFSQRLQQLGGSVVASSRFEAKARDYSASMKQMLGIDDSEARHKALSNTLARNSEFEPRRRDDADFIFIAAHPAEGRMIWPQFRYHRSSGLPLYATSLIYSGSPDTELNGVRFCDSPFMLGGKAAIDNIRTDAADLSSLKSNPRLFALGYDAYTLSRLIQKGDLQSGAVYTAASGELRLGNSGVIGRRLDCAQIESGTPKLLEAAEARP